MNTVGKFLKLRKRYNSIKIAFILSLCTLYFIINGTADVISFGLYINAPTEYLLKSNESGALLDIKAERLLDECEATAVSRQQSYLIENKEGGIITVSALTPEYLFRAYGITAKEGDKKIWLAPSLFYEFTGEESALSVRMTCTDGKERFTADIIQLDILDRGTASAVAAGTSALLRDTDTVKMLSEGLDLSGKRIKAAEKLGFTVMNKDALTEKAHREEIFFSELKYNVICTALSVLGTVLSIKIYKHETKTR